MTHFLVSGSSLYELFVEYVCIGGFLGHEILMLENATDTV